MAERESYVETASEKPSERERERERLFFLRQEGISFKDRRGGDAHTPYGDISYSTWLLVVLASQIIGSNYHKLESTCRQQ